MTTDQPIDPSRLTAILAFVQAAEQLKDTLRSGITANGRAESTAEHSWRLCLMAMLFDRELAGYDRLKLLRLCIVHDLGEAISGDVPATCQRPDDGRAARERADLATLCAPLPGDLARAILDLWDEYSAAATPEAQMVKGFDKLETMLQHLIGRNAPDFDYRFNLSYGAQHTGKHPLLAQMRGLVDAATRERIAELERSAA